MTEIIPVLKDHPLGERILNYSNSYDFRISPYFIAGGGVNGDLWFHPQFYVIRIKGKIEIKEVFKDLTKLKVNPFYRGGWASIWRNLKSNYLELLKGVVGITYPYIWKASTFVLQDYNSFSDYTEIVIRLDAFDKDNCSKNSFQNYLFLNEIDITEEQLKVLKKLNDFPHIQRLELLSDIVLSKEEMSEITERLESECCENTFIDFSKLFWGMNCFQLRDFIKALQHRLYNAVQEKGKMDLKLNELEFNVLKAIINKAKQFWVCSWSYFSLSDNNKLKEFELTSNDLSNLKEDIFGLNLEYIESSFDYEKVYNMIIERIALDLDFGDYEFISECKTQDRLILEDLSTKLYYRLSNWF